MLNKLEFTKPIPLAAGVAPDNWEQLPIQANYNALVPIGPYAQYAPNVFTTGLYAGEHLCSPYAEKPLRGATLSVFLRRVLARKLQAVQEALPSPYHLLVVDGYRSETTQRELYFAYRDQLAQQYPDLKPDDLDTYTQRYVSMPSTQPPSPHRTGGAVDLTLVEAHRADDRRLRKIQDQLLAMPTLESGQAPDIKREKLENERAALMQNTRMLNFGTPLDHGGPRAHLTYYEERLAQGEPLNASEQEAARNRRALFHLLGEVSLHLYAHEWWHADSASTQRGAAARGNSTASFGPSSIKPVHEAHEAMRLAQFARQQFKSGGHWPTEMIAPPSEESVI